MRPALSAGVAPPSAEAAARLSLLQVFWLQTGLYLLLAVVGIFLSRHPGGLATLWYANAVSIVALLARPRRDWPLLLAGTALANLVANLLFGDPLGRTLAFLLGNLVEVVLAAGLMRRFCRPADGLHNPRALARLLWLGLPAPVLLGALVGASALSLQGQGEFSQVWFAWFEGSVIGCFSVLPIGLVLLARGWGALWAQLQRPVVLGALLLLSALAAFAPARLLFPYVYMGVVLGVLAMLGRFPATALGTLVCSFIVGVQVATGRFQVPAGVDAYSEGVFYLPMVLTLLMPLMLAAVLERNQAQVQALAEREQSFRTLYQHTPVMMHSADDQGLLVSVSDTWLDALGYREDEVIGTRFLRFLTPASQRYALEVAVPRFKETGEARNLEYQLLTKAGRLMDVRLSAVWQRDPEGRLWRTLSVLVDVTEEKRLATVLAEEKDRMEVTLHSIGDGVITTDPDGRVNYLNPVAEAMVGWTTAEASGRPFSEVVTLLDQQSRQAVPDPVAQCLNERRVRVLPDNTVLRHRGGREYGVQDTVAPITTRDGRLLGAVMVFQDVTEARSLAQKMAHLAHHDALTDLPNRVLLQDRIHQACQTGLRKQQRFAVVFMDLDHFKHINDSLGHAAGDLLLQTVARRLTLCLRGSDTVCRLGGDEFVMLLPELPGPEAAAEVGQKVLREVARPMLLEGTELRIGISLGVAMFPEDGTDAQTLMKHADVAMYRAKREGRNRCQFFSRSVDEAAAERLRLENDLRRGLAEGHFQLHYQPIVEAGSRRPVGVEALARWTRPGHGPQSPAVFIGVAEESGLIVPLGEWVLQQACLQLRAWAGTALDGVRMAVNVSPLQLARPGFVETLAELLASTGARAQLLDLEITESTLIERPEAMLVVLQQVKALGVKVSIDDFGTGYSSLSHLKNFPVDTVKVDRSFVRDLTVDPSDRELVRAILAMASALGLRVVAEGVETEEQASLLANKGCPTLQGYLMARPADGETTTRWLGERLSGQAEVAEAR